MVKVGDVGGSSNFLSLSLSVDYAHHVNVSDSVFGTNGSEKGKSITLCNFKPYWVLAVEFNAIFSKI